MTDQRSGWLKLGFVGPTLAFLIAFNLFPLCYNVGLSFTDSDLSGGQRRWVGLDNYRTVFGQERFSASLRTTGLFAAAAVAAELALGFVLALALSGTMRGTRIVLTVLLVPMMLPAAVMGLYWYQILGGQYGILNQVLAAVGLGQPLWLNDPSLKLIAILLIDIWMWTPFMMLICLAGLNAIPGHLFEAAKIDRAGRWTVFWRITLPYCAPLVGLAVLLRATDAMKQFDLVMAVTGPNDPATQTFSVLLYQVMFRNQDVGQGSAFACVVLVLVIALAILFTRYIDLLHRRRLAAA